MFSLPTSPAQASLAAAILAGGVGSFMAMTPPNPSPSNPTSGSTPIEDALRSLKLTHKHAPKVILAPLGLMTLHASSLAFFYPNIPSSLVRYGVENGLDTNLITWSSATSIPLALILVGVPLRLIPYASLGKNFTFALTEPDRLTTTGIYRYVQHPSYTGATLVCAGNAMLINRLNGVLSCLIPPRYYQTVHSLGWTLTAVFTALAASMVWTRVRQEEKLLRSRFGAEWEAWHAKTARFIPWIF